MSDRAFTGTHRGIDGAESHLTLESQGHHAKV